jgi:Ran GTPase-activating protein (RanGAP) involved in mRNA processing and transport
VVLLQILPQTCVSDAARALANALESNSTLTHLDLRANEIKERTLRSLNWLLHQCSTLRVLELSGRAVSNEVADLMGCILWTTSLTSLSVTVPFSCD